MNIIGYTTTGVPIRVRGQTVVNDQRQQRGRRKRIPIEDVRNLFDDASVKNVSWMREDLKRRGFKNVSRIDNNVKPPHTTIKDLRLHELKALARARGIAFKSRVKKGELLELMRGNAVGVPEVRLVTTFSNDTVNKFYVDVRDYRSSDADYALERAMEIIVNRIRELLGRGK